MDPATDPPGDGQLPVAKPLRPAAFSVPPPVDDGILAGLPDDDCTAKLAFALGLAKIAAGVLITCLGMGALLLQATLAGIGAGMWAGLTVLVSGVVGICSSRLPRHYGVLVAFLCWSITSLSASALLLIFSATGLARDVRERDAAEPLGGADFLFQAVFPEGVRRPAMALNAALVALAAVDCALSVACVALVCAEACGAPKEAAWGGRAERRTRQERLRCWVDQQQIGLFWPQGTKPVLASSAAWRHGGDFLGTPCHSCASQDTGATTLTRKSVIGSDASADGGRTRY